MNKLYLFIVILMSTTLFSQDLLLASFKDEAHAIKAQAIITELLEDEVDPSALQIVQSKGLYQVVAINIKTTEKKVLIEETLAQKYRELVASSKQDNTHVDPILKEAILHFNDHEYEKSYTLLQQVKLESLSSENIHFYRGRCAFELGKLDEAITEYQEILRHNENNTRVRLELARSYYVLQANDKAKTEFETVLNRPIPPAVRANILEYLDQIEKKNQKNYVAGTLFVGLGYDDNIFNNTYLGTTEYAGINLVNDTESIGDGFHRELLVLAHSYFFDNRSYAIESTLSAFNQMNFSYTEGNIQLLSLLSGPSYRYKNYKFTLPIDGEKIFYGSSSYLNVYGVRPRFEVLLTPKHVLSAKLSLLKKDYLRSSEKDRSSHYYEFLLALNSLLTAQDLLYANALFIADRKDEGSRIDVDKNTLGARLLYTRKLSTSFSASAEGRYEYSSYLQNNPALGDRTDNYLSFVALGNYTLNKHVAFELKYTYERDYSSIAIYNFKKNKLYTNLVVGF